MELGLVLGPWMKEGPWPWPCSIGRGGAVGSGYVRTYLIVRTSHHPPPWLGLGARFNARQTKGRWTVSERAHINGNATRRSAAIMGLALKLHMFHARPVRQLEAARLSPP
jgi:hypothetical protein